MCDGKIRTLLLTLYPNVNLVSKQWIKDDTHTERLVLTSECLTTVFVVEVVMKNIAFTPRGYWQSRRNRYDLLVTVGGVVWILMQTTWRVRTTNIGLSCDLFSFVSLF